jgi:hypothetical protein
LFFHAAIRRALLLGAAVALGSPAALADPKLFVAIDYRPDPALDNCPSEGTLRSMVGEQLAYDPFRTDAEFRIVARTRSSERELYGVVEWYDASGAPRGERELSERTDCTALVRAMAFAIAVQIQLLAREAESAAASANGQSSAPPAVAPVPTVPPPNSMQDAARSENERSKKTAPRWQFLFGAGPTVAFGLAPRTAVEGRIFGGVRRAPWTLELGGSMILPSRYTTESGQGFEQRAFAGSAAGCHAWGAISGCLVGRVGSLSVEGFGVDVPGADSGVTVHVGPRLMLGHLGDGWLAALRVDALVSLASWTVTLSEREIWETAPLTLALGGDLGAVFE